MKRDAITQKVIKTLLERFGEPLREAVGDGESELVDATNFGHLEAGNTYIVEAGSENMRSTFVDWVDKRGNPSTSEDPEQVFLRFRDRDGFEWDAYYNTSQNCYAVGSDADPLYVTET